VQNLHNNAIYLI